MNKGSDVKHPECGHCRHEIKTGLRVASGLSSEALVLHVLGQYKHQALSRGDIRKATGFNPVETMEILRGLVADKKVAYSGTSIESRNAKFKLFG
jgi:hypothetical protein